MLEDDELYFPEPGSRWCRPGYDPQKGPYNGYTVVAVSNTAHRTPKHPPDVVYVGDNGHYWTRPLRDWPGSLVPEEDAHDKEEK